MNLLITGAFKCDEDQINQLNLLGYKVYFLQNEREKLPLSPNDIEVVVCNGLFLYHDIKAFSRLKLIQLTSAGFDRVPLEYIKEKGIKIFNARGVYAIPMAEWVIFRILEYYKHANFFRQNQMNSIWEKHRGLVELCGKKVAIVGAGNIGQEIARKFQAFDCNTTGFDLYLFKTASFDQIYLIDELDARLYEFDIVVLTLPLTEKTFHFFDYDRLKKMKNNSILVNISRGPILNEDDLILFLSEKHPITAILDVFEEEPLSKSSPLWGFKNVLLSPHNSFVGDGNSRRLFSVIYKNLKEHIQTMC